MKCSFENWRTWMALAALMIVNVVFVGCGTLTGTTPTDASQPVPAPPPSGDSEVFQKGDLLKLEFSGTVEPIPPHEEHIKQDGTITLFLVGAIQAAGKTSGELQREIKAAYVPRYYKNLNVVVKGAEQFYYVGGEVRTPGRQLYLGPITVTGAIKSAGDFTDFAKRKKVELKRANGTMHIIDAEKARTDREKDLSVFPGDNITVPRRLW
jgi:protein involved in polysaccharide export with SLBB domain